MRGAVFAIIAALVTLANAQTRTANAQCYEFTDKYQMIFTVNKNSDTDLNFVYALNATDSKSQTCTSDLTPELFKETSTSFEIIINITKTILSVDANCEHTNTGLDFEWRFLSTKYRDLLVKSLDVMYVVRCNFTNATPTFISTYFNVTGGPAENLPQQNSYSFALEILDTSGAVVTNIALGQEVRLRIQQLSGDIVTVTGHSCLASPDSVFDPTVDYELLMADGCPTVYGTRTFLTAGFTGGQSSAVSGILEQFQFVTSDTVYYQCQVFYCFAGNNECANYCASNTGRRKRDVSGEETAEASIRITLNSYPSSFGEQTQATAQECGSRLEVEQNCLDDVGVITGFSVLGGLLFVTVTVAVVTVVRSSRLIEAERSPEKRWH